MITSISRVLMSLTLFVTDIGTAGTMNVIQQMFRKEVKS